MLDQNAEMSERTPVSTLNRNEKTGFVHLAYRVKGESQVRERILSSEEADHWIHRTILLTGCDFHRYAGLYDSE